jgi:hypothetical protein
LITAIVIVGCTLDPLEIAAGDKTEIPTRAHKTVTTSSSRLPKWSRLFSRELLIAILLLVNELYSVLVTAGERAGAGDMKPPMRRAIAVSERTI